MSVDYIPDKPNKTETNDEKYTAECHVDQFSKKIMDKSEIDIDSRSRNASY